MFMKMTRKLLLENSNLFISDRLVLAEISRLLKLEAYEENVENFLDIPASRLKLEYMTVIKEDLKTTNNAL